MLLGMDPSTIQNALKKSAARLSEQIRSRPLVARAVGRHLLRRLRSDDWIKSPLLTSFLRPMTLPRLWRPSQDDLRHVISRCDELGAGATTLDVFEEMLERFEERAVGGVERWFEELGKPRGYWFDKREQALSFEFCAATAMEWADVEKLERSEGRRTPDLVARWRGLTIVADAKVLFGRYWPLKIVNTMLQTLEGSYGLAEVGDVIVIPCRRDIEPELLEAEVDKLSVESLVSGVAALAGGAVSFGVTPSLIMERATVWDRFYGIRAFPAHLPGGDEEWRTLFDSLSPGVDGIARACREAWDQCEPYDVRERGAGRRLDVAFVAGEYSLLHQDLAPTQALVQEWLQSEVWPVYPQRSVVIASPEILRPIWFINPVLQGAHPESPATEA
jgi:hypothetical protein